MSSHSRRRKMLIGLSFVEEAIADTLEEVKESGRNALAPVEISSRVGLDELHFDPRSSSPFGVELCRNLLWKMARNGEVLLEQESPLHPDFWRLAN